MSEPLRLPFDQYQRYRLVSDVVERLRGGRARLRILDVGGRTGLLRGFLPEDEVVLVDLEPSDVRPGLVLGTGSRLPFRSGAFDVVCAFDTLEHVPPEQRAAFVAECARASRGHVVLAGPYAGAAVREAERLLAQFLERKLGVRHRYLAEHAAHGLPVRAETEAALRAAGAAVAAVGHGNVHGWLALMALALYLDEDPGLRPLAEEVHAFYNAELYRGDAAEPVYRHAVVGALGGAPLPDLAGVVGDAGTGGAARLAGFAELFAGLAEFDRERARWRTERDAFERAVDELRTDLAGHREKLAEAEREVAERRAVEATLAADLAAHRKTLATATADLAGHRETLATTRGALEELRGEYARVLGLRAEELRDRGELEARAADLEREVAALRAARDDAVRRAEVAERELGLHRAEIDRLAASERTLAEHGELLLREVAARDRAGGSPDARAQVERWQRLSEALAAALVRERAAGRAAERGGQPGQS